NVTWLSATGLSYGSVTSATRPTGKAVPTLVAWLLPSSTTIRSAAPARLVSSNAAGAAAPSMLAVIVYVPAISFACATTDASPEASVTMLAGTLALAPVAGALKLTVTSGTPMPSALVARTTSGSSNVAVTVADCAEPLTTTIVSAGSIAKLATTLQSAVIGAVV